MTQVFQSDVSVCFYAQGLSSASIIFFIIISLLFVLCLNIAIPIDFLNKKFCLNSEHLPLHLNQELLHRNCCIHQKIYSYMALNTRMVFTLAFGSLAYFTGWMSGLSWLNIFLASGHLLFFHGIYGFINRVSWALSAAESWMFCTPRASEGVTGVLYPTPLPAFISASGA